MNKFGVPVIVTLNSFVTDTEAEIEAVRDKCTELGARFALSEVWEKGGEGGIELAKTVLDTIETVESDFAPLYEDELPLKDKISKIATDIYGAGSVTYSGKANIAIRRIDEMGLSHLPVCIAKTQYSFSDNAKMLGRPTGFEINVREVNVSAGAEFVVAITGDVMTMPGLPKVPAAENIDIDADGKITGLF